MAILFFLLRCDVLSVLIWLNWDVAVMYLFIYYLLVFVLGPGTQHFMAHLGVKTVGPVVHLEPRSVAIVAFTLQFQRTKSVCQVRWCLSPSVDFWNFISS